jgi:hypothetical protein
MLMLGAPVAGTVTYFTNSGVTSGLGLNIAAGHSPLVLTIKDHGDLVRKPWFAILSTGSDNIFVGEGHYHAESDQ